MIWPWVFLALLGGSLLWKIRGHPRRLRLWHDAAVACGLSSEEIPSGWPWRWKLAAQAGPLQVRIEDQDNSGNGTRVVVVVPGPPGFSGVRIRRELGQPGAHKIEIGDKAFDRTFSVEGPPRLVCALLDVETRRLLFTLDGKSRLAIAGGELRAEMLDYQIPAILRLLLDLGQRFTRKTDIVQCLIDNAQRDAEPGVRLSNLILLVRECAWSPRTDEALRTACSDPSPRVRLRAAIELGAEGRDILMQLAESTEDDDCSAQAIRIVGPELPFDRTRAILTQALRKRRRQTAHACVEAFGRSGTAEAVAALAKIMTRHKSDLAAAAAQALEAAGSAAEPSLILALDRDIPNLRVAAAKALGRVGSAAAVLPLKEAAEHSHDGELRRAARQAVAEIQSRLPGASPGQLSLAGAEAGQLSLAQGEAGQLSLATDTAGQLSLPPEEAGELSLSDGDDPAKDNPQ